MLMRTILIIRFCIIKQTTEPTWQGVQIVLLGGPIAQGQSVAQTTVANWRVESAKGGNRFVEKKGKKNSEWGETKLTYAASFPCLAIVARLSNARLKSVGHCCSCAIGLRKWQDEAR